MVEEVSVQQHYHNDGVEGENGDQVELDVCLLGKEECGHYEGVLSIGKNL